MFFFSCLIAVGRTCSIMLTRTDESRHPCLIPDLTGKAFPFEYVSCGLGVYGFYMLRYVPAIPVSA